MSQDARKADFSRLVEIMAQLRDPDTGCPWDLRQDFRSISQHTIEEAYEVADAIEREDYEDLVGELGDLILQPVFHAQIAAESGLFEIDDIIGLIVDKLVRRHPHILDTPNDLSSKDVLRQWERIKEDERRLRAKKRGKDETVLCALDDVPTTLPALMRAEKLAGRASRVGFDWPDALDALDKCQEELNELRAELEAGDSIRVREELGDLLFATVSMARKSGISAEAALRDANIKFIDRFGRVESACKKDGHEVSSAGLDKLQAYWDAEKSRERVDTPAS